MKSLLTVMVCFGFLLYVAPASAQDTGCPAETPYYCPPGPCELGTCTAVQGECNNSPATLGTGCFILGQPGECDGTGTCVEGGCEDLNGDGICDHLCVDSDGDTICDQLDQCPGEDDLLDTDGDGVVDCQDPCPLDNPDDPDGNGECGDQSSCTQVTNTYTDSGNVGPYGQDVHTIEPVISGTPLAISLINPDGIEWNISYAFYDADGSFLLSYGQNGTGSPIEMLVDVPPAAASVNVYLNSRDGALAADYTLYVDYDGFDCSGTGGPTQEVISDSTPGDSWNQHVFNVEPGSQFSVNFETHSGAAFYFVQWDQPGGFGGNQCYKHVTAGQTDSCSNLTVDAAATQAYVSVNGLQFGVDYTITVDYVSSGSSACADTDGDTVCDADDVCPGYDDLNDQDGNGSPDHCDCIKYDIVGTTTWGGNPAFDFDPDGQVSYTHSTAGSWHWYEDDTYACYNVYLDPSNYSDFPRCDFNQDGVVTMDEVNEVYFFATLAGTPIGGPYAIATCNQIL